MVGQPPTAMIRYSSDACLGATLNVHNPPDSIPAWLPAPEYVPSSTSEWSTAIYGYGKFVEWPAVEVGFGYFDVVVRPSDPDSQIVTPEEDGIVREIALVDGTIPTDRGLRIGSTRAEALAAYPEAVLNKDVSDYELYSVQGKHGWLHIAIEPNDDDKTEIVAQLASSITVSPPWAMSDYRPGKCHLH